MHTCISSHGLKRSWHSRPKWVNACNKNTLSMHHPRRQNVTTSVVGLKTVTFTKISPKLVNPRDIARNRRRWRRIMHCIADCTWLNWYAKRIQFLSILVCCKKTGSTGTERQGLGRACIEHVIIWKLHYIYTYTGVALTFEKLRIANAQHGKNCVSSPAAKATISTDLPKIDKHENTNV